MGQRVLLVGDSGAHSSFSNVNAEVDLAAPGGDSTTGHGKITSTALGGGTATEEGTSFASPYVTCWGDLGEEGSHRKIFALVPRTEES